MRKETITTTTTTVENNNINNEAFTHIKEKISRIFTIVGKIFFVVGIILIGIGIYFLVDYTNFSKSGKTVEATIKAIHVGSVPMYDSDIVQSNITILIEYTIDGNQYERLLPYYDTSMYVGKTMTIKYNPDNHNDIRYSQPIAQYIFISIGAVFVVLGMAFIITIKRKQIKRNPYE